LALDKVNSARFFPLSNKHIQNNCYFHSSFDDEASSRLAIKHNLSITSSPEVSRSCVHFLFPIARTDRRSYINFCLPAHTLHTHTCISRRVLSVILRPTLLMQCERSEYTHSLARESVMHFIWRSQSTFSRRRRSLLHSQRETRSWRQSASVVYNTRRAARASAAFLVLIVERVGCAGICYFCVRAD
jgi:hypothetical protein